MTPPLAYKIKITNTYVPAANSDIRPRITAERMRLETVEFVKALAASTPLAVQPFSSERKAKNEYRNKDALENAS